MKLLVSVVDAPQVEEAILEDKKVSGTFLLT